MDKKISFTCGSAGADFPGYDNRAIQEAVNYASSHGGGEVLLEEGIFLLSDSVHLKDNVVIRGCGIDKTILKKNASVKTTTENFCGYGHKEIMVTDGSIFRVGDGVYIRDDTTPGFFATQTTITAVEDNVLFLEDPLCGDIIKHRNGMIETLFPMIKGDYVKSAWVSHLTLEGNWEENGYLEGCRGGGIYLIGCGDIFIEHVRITHFNGDGISYQQCCNIRFEHSICNYNRGNGMHPGSGTVGMLIRDCDISNNQKAGIFYCLRICYNICQKNRICNNGLEGITIGHRDDYIDLGENEIRGNGKEGIFFRVGNYPGMSGKYTSIHHNKIWDNGRNSGKAQIYAPAGLTGLEMYENEIGGEQSWILEGDFQECYHWKNQLLGLGTDTTGMEGWKQNPPKAGVRVIDIDHIPEKEYRHLVMGY